MERALVYRFWIVAVVVWLTACGSAQRGKDHGPRGTVRFDGQPADASLEIDDTSLGPIGMFKERGVLLRPGKHRIVVRADNYFPEYRLVEVVEAEVKVIKVVLRPVPQ